MEPGRTYITVPPGRTNPVFVRERRKPIRFPFGISAIAEALAPFPMRRSYSADTTRGEFRVLSAPAAPAVLTSHQPGIAYPTQTLSAPYGSYHTYGGHPFTANVVSRSGRTNEIILQHTCSSCGKFRSPSYHSRHPLTPGEVPRLGLCRKCLKEHTSSEESDEEESRRWRSRRHEKSRRKKHRRRRHARHSDSTKDSSSSRDEVRIIRRSHSASRGSRSRRRSKSRSSSNSQTRIRISYEPGERRIRRSSRDGARIVETTKYLGEPRRSRFGSRSRNPSGHVLETVRYVDGPRRSRSRSSSRSPPRNFVERVRYVDEPRRCRSRSRSRSSGRHETLRYERSGELHVEEDRPIRSYNVVERRSPGPYGAIEYSHDDDPIEQVIRRRPSMLRRSESLDAHYGTPYPARRRGYFDHSSGTYSGHVHDDRQYAERSYEYEPHVDLVPRPPSRSVRVIRVSSEDRGSEEVVAPRVHFTRPASPRRTSVIERSVVESSEPLQRRRRRRVRAIDDALLHERSDEYFPPGKEKPLANVVPRGLSDCL